MWRSGGGGAEGEEGGTGGKQGGKSRRESWSRRTRRSAGHGGRRGGDHVDQADGTPPTGPPHRLQAGKSAESESLLLDRGQRGGKRARQPVKKERPIGVARYRGRRGQRAPPTRRPRPTTSSLPPPRSSAASFALVPPRHCRPGLHDTFSLASLKNRKYQRGATGVSLGNCPQSRTGTTGASGERGPPHHGHSRGRARCGHFQVHPAAWPALPRVCGGGEEPPRTRGLPLRWPAVRFSAPGSPCAGTLAIAALARRASQSCPQPFCSRPTSCPHRPSGRQRLCPDSDRPPVSRSSNPSVLTHRSCR